MGTRIMLFCFGLALPGCTAMPTVQRSHALADAGVVYATAAVQLLDESRNRYIDYDSDALLAELDGLDACTPDDLNDEDQARPGCKESIASFDSAQDRVRESARSMVLLRVQAQALGAYFQALNELAAEDAGPAVQASVEGLASQLNGLNQILGGKAALSDAKQAAYAGLTGYLGVAYKAGKLRNALQRDAQVISLAIDLQERTLGANSGLLQAIGAGRGEGDYLLSVRRPYLLETVPDNADWGTQRREMLLRESTLAQLETLRVASQRLRLIWADILDNRTNPSVLKQLFDDLSRALELIQGLRDAGASPGT